MQDWIKKPWPLIIYHPFRGLTTVTRIVISYWCWEMSNYELQIEDWLWIDQHSTRICPVSMRTRVARLEVGCHGVGGGVVQRGGITGRIGSNCDSCANCLGSPRMCATSSPSCFAGSPPLLVKLAVAIPRTELVEIRVFYCDTVNIIARQFFDIRIEI